MKANKMEAQMNEFLISATKLGEASASHPSRLIPGEKTPAAHWTGGWMKRRGGLNVLEKRKPYCPAKNRNTIRR
jgi:hypothetical protein